jgi:phenylacetate-CoA ligase
LSANFDQRIRDQIAHAYYNAPAIQQIMDAAGVTPDDIQTAADLQKIPVTSKDKLVEIHAANPPFGGFLAVDPITLPRIYISPGPIYDPQPYDETTAHAAEVALREVDLGTGDRVLNTFMYHLTPAGLLMDEGLRAIGCTVIPTGPGNTELQVKMMMDLQVVGYVGTPSFLEIILDKAAEFGIPNDAIPIKKGLFTAEPYTVKQRARFEGDYGMRTVSAYGTADLGYIAYTSREVEGFCVSEAVYMEIVDPDTGKTLAPGELGEIVCTTFNKAYPLVRFGTGDLGVMAAEVDPRCGGSQQLLGLYGRAGGAVKVRGMFLHPNQLQGALDHFPQVKHAQAVITRPERKDVVTLRVELHPGEAADNLAERLKEAVHGAVRLRVDSVEIVEKGIIDPAQRMVRDERVWE